MCVILYFLFLRAGPEQSHLHTAGFVPVASVQKYKADVEASFREHHHILQLLFEGYARSGPCGSTELISLSEWLEVFDRDATPLAGASTGFELRSRVCSVQCFWCHVAQDAFSKGSCA